MTPYDPWLGKRYFGLNAYFRGRFGGKVARVPVDAGFTCPNRDGTLGFGGCTFCNEAGARARFVEPELPLRDQISRGIGSAGAHTGAGKFLVYFQAYTNTYAPAGVLERLYREALDAPGSVGIAIGTRPDCLPPETVELIAELAKTHYVLVELGVQSANDRALEAVNRGHTSADSRRAMETLKSRTKAEVLSHLVFGLPGDTRADWERSVLACVDWGADALKLHHLYIERGTAAERLWREGKWTVPERQEYLDFLAGVLPRIPERVVLHRLFGQCSRETLAAPLWTADKLSNLTDLDRLLEERDLRQGSGTSTTNNLSGI